MTKLKNADLAFVLPKKSKLDQAIDQSTVQHHDRSFVHVAIVEETKNQEFFIIEATGQKGVVRRPLNDFIDEHPNRIRFFRTKQSLQDANHIIERAKTHLGEPYNHGFFQNGPGYYCSQLVIEAFQKENIFQETPLSFGPEGSILPHWIEYYQDLGQAIPVDQLGSSPNSLIASQQLQEIQ